MGVEVFSTLVGSGIQGQIVGEYHASMMKSCSVPNGTQYNSTSPGLTDTLANTVSTWPLPPGGSLCPPCPLAEGQRCLCSLLLAPGS